MGDYDPDTLMELLAGESGEVLQRLFTPAPSLIGCGSPAITGTQYAGDFDTAVQLYRIGRYNEAQEAFTRIRDAVGASHAWLGRLATFDAAACAMGAGDYICVVELLEDMHLSGNLWGPPLWNLSLCYLRLGYTAKAADAVETWICRLRRGDDFLLTKGLLVAACLRIVVGDTAVARQHLLKALDGYSGFVEKQLRVSANAQAVAGTAESLHGQDARPAATVISDRVRGELMPLMAPKRPDRSPALTMVLQREDMERYAAALEVLAEGDTEAAKHEIARLCEQYPNAAILFCAFAAVLLMCGDDARAGDVYLGVEHQGYKLTGADLWNLGCAQIRIGDMHGARQALEACADTEYRTKRLVWVALDALGSTHRPTGLTGVRTPRIPLVASQTALDRNLPVSTTAACVEVLRRLIPAKRLPKAFRPDLGRLPSRERDEVSQALDTARRLEPADAARFLVPLVEEFPDVYTLRAHAAGNLLVSGEMELAHRLLRGAEKLQHLDAISRYNLAYIHLTRGEYQEVVQALEEGAQSSLKNIWTFWLALAVARKLCGALDASEAAGRAVAMTAWKPQERIVQTVLRKTGIEWSAIPSADDPATTAANAALGKLDAGDVEGAARVLSDACPDVSAIPELGPEVLEPVVYSVPPQEWDERRARVFESAVLQYKRGRFQKAATAFSGMYKDYPRPGLALNAAAAYIKASQPKAAVDAIRGVTSRRRHGPSWLRWRIAYNHALAVALDGDTEKAVQIASRDQGRAERRLAGLLIAICDTRRTDPMLQATMAAALEDLRGSVHTPSDDLLITLSRAMLSQPIPNAERAREALRVLVQRTQEELPPAAEVNSVAQVRSAFEHLQSRNQLPAAVEYMGTVAEARVRERESAFGSAISMRQLEQNFGVEYAARCCVIRAHDALGNRELALRELREAEALLQEYAPSMPPGFLVRNWLELAELADGMGLDYPAIRFCERGVAIEPENTELLAIRERLSSGVGVRSAAQALHALDEFCGAVQRRDHTIPVPEVLHRTGQTLASLLEEIVAQLDADDDSGDLEELCDRIQVAAQMELSEKARERIGELISWVMRTQIDDETRSPVDIEVHDEVVWPREDDDREAACLLMITSRHDIVRLAITDPQTERVIWEGPLQAECTEFARWIFYREDGFAPGTWVDLVLSIETDDAGGRKALGTTINVLVGSGCPNWPTYPTGALTPDDVPGGDLYGRLGVIKRVIRSLGAKRSQAAFLVQAPRQMGKTSLLYFIRRQVPTHVFPVYVNLERLPSLAQGGGLWGLLTQRVLEEDAGHSIPQCASRRSEADLVDVVSEVCNRRHAAYALIMLDELHFLFDGCEHPAQALASFRDFLNSPDKRIALLLADRYTRVELERRCPSEYWAQLTDLDLGPLDVQSTRQAVEFPARGSDVIFLPSTASRLHQLTSGYPYHVQRGAQYLLDDLYAGPWLVALPDDVDEVVPRMLEQDVLFQSGLCRPDRVDAEIMDGVSALLEWKDLRDLLPALMAESPGEEGTLAAWQPDARAFLENVGDPDLLGQRLRSIGILNDQGDEFFSPLLEKWLRKMRRQQRNLAGDGSSATWQFTRFPDGGVPTARDWQNLDGLLAQRARSGGGTPPLRPKATRADDWDALVRDVTSEEGFRTFVDSAFRLLIDEREDKQALVRYPWLFLVYHRTRLVRNYVVHSSRTKAALSAWDAVCTSALGGERLGYWPTSGEEWHLMQMALLRMLHAGMRSAIASTVVAGQ